MIFYFSGTGNSRYVAQCLSERLGCVVADMPSCDIGGIEWSRSDFFGFVFPVYSWGVPPNVMRFIESLPESMIHHINVSDIPVWCVMTCGDEVALAPEMFMKAFSMRGVAVESIWSVIMPNNYVLLPGFDVDSTDVERRKLDEAPSRIVEIAEGISQHRKTVDVVRGGQAWIKTKAVYPLFRRWGISPKKWHSTPSCVGCGKCVRSCPVNNVVMEGGHPVWGEGCCSCLACYHSCPRHAVEYGKLTKKKGQYYLLTGKPTD